MLTAKDPFQERAELYYLEVKPALPQPCPLRTQSVSSALGWPRFRYERTARLTLRKAKNPTNSEETEATLQDFF